MVDKKISVTDLRDAFQRGQIIPYFQPIVSLRNGELQGFEMLARWLHPDEGLILPDRFIPLAESSGLIPLLFESLTAQTLEIAAASPGNLNWAVNLAATQMSDRALPRWLQTTAERYGVPLHQITVELTETGLIHDFKLSALVASELKEMGIHLAIDDFGTGYSSLMYVSALPLDALKIDQHFIRSMGERTKSRKIAAAIAGMGQSLDVITIAEGIEKREHAEMLFYLGCNLGQGYLFGRPMPASELPAVIEKRYLAGPPASPLLATTIANTAEVAPALQMAHLKALYECLPMGLVLLDRDLRYVSVNKWWTDRLNPADNPRLGLTMAEFVPPAVYARYEPYMRKALNGEPTINLLSDPAQPGYVLYGDSYVDSHVLLSSTYPVRDEAGDIIGVLVCILDITDQVKAEHHLSSQTAKYTQPLIDHAITIFTVDPNGMLDWIGMNSLEVPDELILGVEWHGLVHPDEREHAIQTWAEAVRRQGSYFDEFRVQNANDGWHLFQSRAVPRFGEHGELLGWSGLLQDLGRARDQSSRPLVKTTPPDTTARQ